MSGDRGNQEGGSIEVRTKNGGVRYVCEVCGKDRHAMASEWDGSKWLTYCYLHWGPKKIVCSLDKWMKD